LVELPGRRTNFHAREKEIAERQPTQAEEQGAVVWVGEPAEPDQTGKTVKAQFTPKLYHQTRTFRILTHFAVH